MKSGVYSTWTESTWQTLTVRMFLKPSDRTERLSIILGCLVATSSFVLVWFINNRADVLFNSRFVLSRTERFEQIIYHVLLITFLFQENRRLLGIRRGPHIYDQIG